MIRRFSIPILLIFLSVLVAAVSARGQETTPRAVVETFLERLLAVMKEARALGAKGRYERLAPAIEEAFHVPIIAKAVTGAFWKNADREQKRRLVAAFKRMSISTLATLFDDYSGQAFKTMGEKVGRQNIRIVETRIVDPDKSFVDIAYMVASVNDRWYIVDVIAARGISELQRRRSDYHSTLKTKGVEGLITALNAKADELIER